MKLWFKSWRTPLLALALLATSTSWGATTWGFSTTGNISTDAATATSYTAYLIAESNYAFATAEAAVTAGGTGTLSGAALTGAIATSGVTTPFEGMLTVASGTTDAPFVNGAEYYVILVAENGSTASADDRVCYLVDAKRAVDTSSTTFAFNALNAATPVGSPAVVTLSNDPVAPTLTAPLAISFGVRNVAQTQETFNSETWNCHVGDFGDGNDSAFSVAASSMKLTDGSASPYGLTTTAWSVGGTGGMTTAAKANQITVGDAATVAAIFPVAAISGHENTSAEGGCTQQGASNNNGAASSMTVTGLTPGAQYKLSVFVARNNVWAASSTQNFTLSAGASGISTTLDGYYVAGGATPVLNGDNNGFSCYAAGNWTCGTFAFTATATSVVLSSTGGSNIGGLKLTQTALAVTYAASASGSVNWADLQWTKSDDATVIVTADLPSAALATLSLSDDATITFDASNPDTIASLAVTGTGTFVIDGFTPTIEASSTQILTAAITGADGMTVAFNEDLSNYELTTTCNATGLSVSVYGYTHMATVDVETPWVDIGWTDSTGTTASTVPDATSVVKISAVDTPTIALDASTPITLGSLKITGDPVFAIENFAITGTPVTFTETVFSATITGADAATATVDPVEGYSLTAQVTATGILVSGGQDGLRMISVNVIGGNGGGRTGRSVDSGTAGVIPVDAANWNNLISRDNDNGFTETFSTIKELSYAEGTVALVDRKIDATLKAGCCYTRGLDPTPTNGDAQLAFGYLDDRETVTGTSKGATITLEHIPYTEYEVYVYFGSDSANGAFGPVNVNNQWYTWANGALSAIATPDTAWGSRNASRTAAVTWTEGQNYLKFTAQTNSTFTVSGAKSGAPQNTRCGIAGVQIVCTGDLIEPIDFTAAVAEGEVAWGDVQWSPSNFVDGALNTATLTFDGSVADFDFNQTITADTVTLAGTGPVTFTKGDTVALTGVGAFDFSGLTDTTMVNFGTGASAVSAGDDTILSTAGTGALTIGAGKKATFEGFGAWAGTLAGAGTLQIRDAADLTSVLGGLSVVYSGATTLVTLSDTLIFGAGALTFTDGARLVSTQTTTIADPEAGATNSEGSRPGFRFRPSASVTFSAGASFSMPNGYLELCWDNQVANIGSGEFTLTGENTCVSVRGIGGGNIYNSEAQLKVEDGAVLEIGSMGLRHASGVNLYRLTLNNGTLRAAGSFDVEAGVKMSLAADSVNTFDAGVNTLTYGQFITGTGALKTTSSGAGMVVLGGANNYSGGTTLEAGTLKVTNATALGSGNLTFTAGTKLDLSAITTTVAMQTVELLPVGSGTAEIALGERAIAAGDVIMSWTVAPEVDAITVTGGAGFTFQVGPTGLVAVATGGPAVVDPEGTTLTDGEIAAVQAAADMVGVEATTIKASPADADKLMLFSIPVTDVAFTDDGAGVYTLSPIAASFEVTSIAFNDAGQPIVTATATAADGTEIQTTIVAQVKVFGKAALADAWTQLGNTFTTPASTFTSDPTATYKFFKFVVEPQP